MTEQTSLGSLSTSSSSGFKPAWTTQPGISWVRLIWQRVQREKSIEWLGTQLTLKDGDCLNVALTETKTAVLKDALLEVLLAKDGPHVCQVCHVGQPKAQPQRQVVDRVVRLGA